MKILKHRFTRRLALFIAALSLHQGAQALSFSIDTSALAGTDARLEINLLDGDLDFGNNQASAFGSTIFDPDSILRDFVAGGIFTFDVDITHNFSGGNPDLLIINLLDPDTNFSLVDTNLDALAAAVPYQDALFVCSVDSSRCSVASASDPNLGLRVSEPGSLALLALLPGLGALCRTRRQSLPTT